MLRIKQAIIVEGRYDKITLENVVDALIIPTNGFGIFSDKEKCALIRTLAKRQGIIVMTDSDKAGSVIRSYLKNIVGDGEIINVYLPQLKGKERRKQRSSKEGLLGLEGMSADTIEQALSRFNITGEMVLCKRDKITKTQLFCYGLSGGENSAKKRESLLHYLGLPEYLSANKLLDIINTLYEKQEFEEMMTLWQEAKKS